MKVHNSWETRVDDLILSYKQWYNAYENKTLYLHLIFQIECRLWNCAQLQTRIQKLEIQFNIYLPQYRIRQFLHCVNIKMWFLKQDSFMGSRVSKITLRLVAYTGDPHTKSLNC